MEPIAGSRYSEEDDDFEEDYSPTKYFINMNGDFILAILLLILSSILIIYTS